MEAQAQHRHQGNRGTCRKHQIQREHIAQHAVDQGRECHATSAGRLDKAQNRAPVLLRQRQHQGSIEHRIPGRICHRRKEKEDAQRHKLITKICEQQQRFRDRKAQGQHPEAGLRAQFHDTQQHHAQQRCSRNNGTTIAVHIHGEALFQRKRKHQRHGACAQKVENQSTRYKNPQAAIGKNRFNSNAEIPQGTLYRYSLSLLDRFGHADKQLGNRAVQIAAAIDHHDQRHTEQGDHSTAEGAAHQIDQGAHTGSDRLTPDHIIMGNNVQQLGALNIMGLHSPESAILSAIIFNAIIIPILIPLALKGVEYKPIGASALLRRNLLIYGVGGIIAPFAGIKLIDLFVGLFF